MRSRAGTAPRRAAWPCCLRTEAGMRLVRKTGAVVAAVALALVAWPACSHPGPPASDGGQPERPARKPDVPYEPTPRAVVQAMLDLAEVRPGDVVYDLGCGDGRIVIEAAKRGARGVGVDLDPARVREATANARAAGVEDRVEIREG